MNGVAWSEFETKLSSYVHRRVDGGAVDDVVGEILLRLVRSQDKMEGANNPMAWMYRVAANVITDHYRRSASEERLIDAIKFEATETQGSGSEAALNDTDSLAQCLIPMIRSLPETYAEALMLIEIEGLSQVAAARQLGLSVSGMKSRIQRARRKLKSALLQCCEVQVSRRGEVLNYKKRGDKPNIPGPNSPRPNCRGEC